MDIFNFYFNFMQTVEWIAGDAGMIFNIKILYSNQICQVD